MTAATNALRSMIVTASEPLRAQLPASGLPNKIIDTCARLRPDFERLNDPTQATKAALRSIDAARGNSPGLPSRSGEIRVSVVSIAQRA